MNVNLDASIRIDLTATFLLMYLPDRMFSLFDDTHPLGLNPVEPLARATFQGNCTNLTWILAIHTIDEPADISYRRQTQSHSLTQYVRGNYVGNPG